MISIIIVQYNNSRHTHTAIESFRKHHVYNYEIILVDNGSTDNSISQFNKNFHRDKRIVIIKNGANLGYVEGNNSGIRYAIEHSFDYVLIINNDVLVKRDFLEILLKRANAIPGTGIFGPKIYFAPGFEYHHDRYSEKQRGKIIWSVGGRIDWSNIIGSNIGIDQFDQGQFDQIKQSTIDFISGCCLLVKTTVFKKIGLFDQRYFLFLEDADFCQRAKKAGFQISVVPQSIIWHLNSQTTGAGSHLHDYFLTRNRLLFGFTYGKLRSKLALVRESFNLFLFDPSLWKRKGVLDFYLRKLGQGSWL